MPGAGEYLATADILVTRSATERERVCALLAGGGYAEYAAVPREQLLPVPRGFSDVQSAAIPETFFTVWSNIVDRAKAQPGEVLLVHGGPTSSSATNSSVKRTRRGQGQSSMRRPAPSARRPNDFHPAEVLAFQARRDQGRADCG